VVLNPYRSVRTPIVECHDIPNREVLEWLSTCSRHHALVMEVVRPRGMLPIYKELVDTAIWIGRFQQMWDPAATNDHSPGGNGFFEITREQVKRAILGKMNGKDSQLRAATIDLFGGKDRAIGKKASAGPLYDIKSDMWSALAIAIAWWKRSVDGEEACERSHERYHLTEAWKKFEARTW